MASLLARRLYNLHLRARRRGLPADLYLSAWRQTLEDFQEHCAYCDTGLGFTIDHFQPIVLGGPTSVDNCLPYCHFCNNLKGALPPERVFRVPKERIEHLRLYLKRRGAGLRGWPVAEVRSHAKTSCVTLHTKKEESMTVEQTHRSKTSLPHGREVILMSTPSQIVLQLQQHKQSEDDLLSPVVNVAAVLTPQECVALASELLRVASPFLDKPVVSTNSNWGFLHIPPKRCTRFRGICKKPLVAADNNKHDSVPVNLVIQPKGSATHIPVTINARAHSQANQGKMGISTKEIIVKSPLWQAPCKGIAHTM